MVNEALELETVESPVVDGIEQPAEVSEVEETTEDEVETLCDDEDEGAEDEDVVVVLEELERAT